MALIYTIVIFFIAVILHGSIQRIIKGLNPVTTFLIVGIPLGCILTLIEIMQYGFSEKSISAISFYMLLSELYIFIFTLVMSSISVNLIFGIGFNKLKICSDDKQNYKKMVNERLNRLVKNGFLDFKNEEYIITQKGDHYNNLFTVLKNFFHRDKK